MKNPNRFIAIACLLVAGCSSTNTVSIPVLEPPLVALPSDVGRIGIVDRTGSEEGAGLLATIDETFSVKGPELDSLGATAGLEGLAEELSKNERLTEIAILGPTHLKSHAYGALPAPISWVDIDRICREQDLDGLVALEFYETETHIDYSTRGVTREGPLDIQIPLLEHHASVETSITMGWRIYDLKGREIIDELVMVESVVTTGSGINPATAVKAITGRTEAVKTLSGDMGRAYARRLLPYRSRLVRDYYVRGTEAFKLARRRAQTGNWEGAAALWLLETENPKKRVAGRAHHNMAIISEIRGDLDEAIGWARIAYEEYEDKRALRYLRSLQERRARLMLD